MILEKKKQLAQDDNDRMLAEMYNVMRLVHFSLI